VIFGGVMEESCDHHVFCDRETSMPSLTHDQGCNPQKMRHVRYLSALSPLDVDVTSIFDCGRKSATQVKMFDRIDIRFPALCFHSVSLCIDYGTRMPTRP
jgi:hypothetical protein